MRIKPFEALRPGPDMAAAVSSAPYDVMDTVEASALARGNPDSFLHIIRSEIDLPPGTDVHADAVYAKAAENLRDFQDRGTLVREETPCIYLYRQQSGSHTQSGLVACCHIEDYESGVIKKHEKTRPDKELDRARHIRELNANTGPVFLTYRDDPKIDAIVAAEQEEDPLFDFSSPDGVRHTAWRVPAADNLVAAFDTIPVCYVADGHHRAHCAAAVGGERRSANSVHKGTEEYNWFIGVLFPASQLRVLAYNRTVRDLNGMTPEEFLAETGCRFKVKETTRHAPEAPRTVNMYLDGRWYELAWQQRTGGDTASSLDLTVLHGQLLGPVLGIHDARTSKRISFVGGAAGSAELVKRVDSERDAAAFSMYPVSIEDLMAVSDAGQIMPPKSTWFEPKLRSGLFVHTL